ncbi:MAG: hypothetical protein HYU74_12690 [Dechloromonas sp.]|nr:hypothetical protein [Dechloromonas sp.]
MFDSALFDSAAFDAASGGELIGTGTAFLPIDVAVYQGGLAALDLSIAVYQTGVATLPLAISVVTPLVFDAGEHHVRWARTITIGGLDVSSRATGVIKISGAEDSARVASFSVIPLTVEELDGYDGQAVTIDITLWRPGQSATYRLFTGVVESDVFSPFSRVVEIVCRDGYQERPKACTSAVDVERLFGDLATPCATLHPWNAAEPNPAAYFSGLLETMRGACAIDSNGIWQAVPWAIGAALDTFDAPQLFDDTLRVMRPDRVDLPANIHARLNVRYARLHAVELPLTWTSFPESRYITDGLPHLQKSLVQGALDGLQGWFVKGVPAMVSPAPGFHSVIIGGVTKEYLVPEADAPTYCDSLEVTMYRRWYQQVETAYSVSLPMGGVSDRDETVSASLESTFDHGQWEVAPSSETTVGLYQANAPVGGGPPVTGYEGLPEPWPAANSAIDWLPDISPTELNAAAAFVLSRALRKAAAGKRKRRVRFSKPVDPRWEIGAVLAVDAWGVAATGQVVEFEHSLDLDSGDIESTFTLACPEGTGFATTFTATVAPPTNTVLHALSAPALGTHVGSAFETPAAPDEDTLLGFLCNVSVASENYSAAKPAYQPQFRLIMPAIAALERDPLQVESAMTTTTSIASGSLAITF